MIICCLKSIDLIYAEIFGMSCPSGFGQQITIPVVMISKSDGEVVKKMVLSGKKG